jgi:NAD(P)-dependent dehydrogenase (short-subunit alcohol dehydrogenase family)
VSLGLEEEFGVRLSGKVALITGAASGMGRVATRMFVEHGAQVIAADLKQEGLNGTLAEIDSSLHASVLTVTGDVSRSDDVKRWIDAGVERFGKVNVLYNNAGIMPDEDTSVIETSEETFQRIMDVNVKGIFLCCKHGIPALQAAGGGSVINIGSFVAHVGCTNPQDAYTASKGAVQALTHSLAIQYGKHGIRANTICPGPVLTPMMETLFATEAEKMKRLNRIAMGRFGRAEDIVWAGIFLASDESSWMTGQEFTIDGGITANYF